MRLSIIIPALNSHEVVRRQLLWWGRMDLPDDVEIILVDDGSDPPIEDTVGVKNLRILQTHDTRPWTWALARNLGAREAQGVLLLMVDLDHILPRDTILSARECDADRMGFKRHFGVLDESGQFTASPTILLQYGLQPSRLKKRLTPHANMFCMRRDVFFELGGYREDLVGRKYPQGEDSGFKSVWLAAMRAGKYRGHEYMPPIYMFPNGKYCGDADFNPFGLFHRLSRK